MYNDLKGWIAKPYNEDGNVLDWVLFIGLTVALTYLWTRVIRSIVE